MSVTLGDLKNVVYDRLGDEGFFEDTPAPTMATLAAAIRQINRAITELVNRAAVRRIQLLHSEVIVPITKDYYIQLITVEGTPDGGHWHLTYYGVETASMSWGEGDGTTATVVETALNAVHPLSSSRLSLIGGDGGPYTFLATDPYQTRGPVPLMTGDGSSLTGTGTGTITMTALSDPNDHRREYNLDHYCRNSSGVPDFRGDLTVFRTDGANPVPVSWIQGSNWKRRERGYGIGARWPAEYVDGVQVLEASGGPGLSMYVKWPLIGFERTPTEDMELTVHYTPKPALLVADADYLGVIPGTTAEFGINVLGLTVLESEAELIGSMAANALKGDISSPSGQRLFQQMTDLTRQFDARIEAMVNPTRPRAQRRWAN